MEHKPYWPALFYRPRLRKAGYIRHFRFFDYAVRRLEIAFAIPLPRKYVDTYCLEFLATFKGLAKRRLLVCFCFEPFHLPNRKLLRLEWQEKFDPIEGEWEDEFPSSDYTTAV